MKPFSPGQVVYGLFLHSETVEQCHSLSCRKIMKDGCSLYSIEGKGRPMLVINTDGIYYDVLKCTTKGNPMYHFYGGECIRSGDENWFDIDRTYCIHYSLIKEYKGGDKLTKNNKIEISTIKQLCEAMKNRPSPRCAWLAHIFVDTLTGSAMGRPVTNTIAHAGV